MAPTQAQVQKEWRQSVVSHHSGIHSEAEQRLSGHGYDAPLDLHVFKPASTTERALQLSDPSTTLSCNHANGIVPIFDVQMKQTDHLTKFWIQRSVTAGTWRKFKIIKAQTQADAPQDVYRFSGLYITSGYSMKWQDNRRRGSQRKQGPFVVYTPGGYDFTPDE